MLRTKEDTHLLFYNVFGFCQIERDQTRVSLNIYKDGKIQGRVLQKELDAPLPHVSRAIIMPFGAWVQEDQVYFTPGKLEGYDAEAYEINKTIIDEIIKSALNTIKGAVGQ